MSRMVLLEHTQPDGGLHYDWLLDRVHPDSLLRPPGSPLVSFRLQWRADSEMRDGTRLLEAERMKDHRPLYLDYEGPLSGGRGSVRRVAEGEVVSLIEGEGWIEISCRWGDGGCVHGWRGHLVGGDLWAFERR